MHSTAIYAQLRKCFARALVGVDPDTIRADHDLEKKYHLDAIARSVLANTLNKCFAAAGISITPRLRASQTQGAKNVRDLFNLLRARIPE